DAEILHVGEAARHLVGDVEAHDRAAHDLVILRRLDRRLLVELEREIVPAGELAIGEGLAGGRCDDAVADAEVARFGIESVRCVLEQRAPRRRRRLAQLHAAILDRQAAGGVKAVSPWITAIRAIRTSSSLATIWV